LTACDWIIYGCAYDDRFGGDGCETIDVSSQLDFDDVAFGDGL
jgi:hypothetical protein